MYENLVFKEMSDYFSGVKLPLQHLSFAYSSVKPILRKLGNRFRESFY